MCKRLAVLAALAFGRRPMTPGGFLAEGAAIIIVYVVPSLLSS